MTALLPDPALAAYALQLPVTTFALAAAGTNNATIGIRAGAGEYVWKTYQTHLDPELVHDEHRLVRWLSTQPLSFAVPAPLPAITGETLCVTPEGYKALFPLLAGRRPDRADPQQIEAVGAALGELQVYLRQCPQELIPRLPAYGELHRIHPLIEHPADLTPHQLGLVGSEAEVDLLAWWRDELVRLDMFIAGSYSQLPRQVIHGDFAPSNTLYANGKVTAMLDFEVATYDVRAIDVAAGLKFSMRMWEQADPWSIGAGFCRGYARWVRLTGAELEAMAWLMRLRDAASTIWWLGRALAAGRPPRLQRMKEFRAFVTWLDAHAARLEDILILSGIDRN